METKLPWYLNPIVDFKKPLRRSNLLHRCSLRHCVECKKVWQYDYSNPNNKKFIKYDDMPKYGLTKKTCEKCKQRKVQHENTCQ
tara:strand:- start:172 stop:423 length:252 start_codon:yes stop_codon:yes gene_type:complete